MAEMRLTAPALTFACLTLAACSDAAGPRRLGPGVHIVSGAGVSDSILTVLSKPLVVEALDSTGAGIPNLPITFTAVYGQSAYPGQVSVSGSGQPYSFVNAITTSTDSTGLASVRVQCGGNAGNAAITVTAQGQSSAATARYTVLAGRPVGVRAIPSDTALYVGHQFTLRGAVVDQFGNQTSQTVQYGSPSPEVSISGNVIGGVRIGRGSYVVSATVAGTLMTDTGYVSVVPVGVLAATDNSHIYVFNTDGSGFHVLVAVHNSGIRWSPSGAEIAYDESLIGPDGDDAGGPDSLIHAVDTLGNVRTITSASIGGVHQGPQYTRDGQWIYFARYPGNFEGSPRGAPALWRIHPDGTGAMAMPVSAAGSYGYPTPSPDGSQLAFQVVNTETNAPFDWGGTITSLTVSTGSISSLSVYGEEPVWSPTGNVIAYLNDIGGGDDQGPIWVMNSDGTGQRAVGTGSYNPGLDWSPDGQWIVAENIPAFKLEIVNVQTGLRLPLAYTPFNTAPAWRP